MPRRESRHAEACTLIIIKISLKRPAVLFCDPPPPNKSHTRNISRCVLGRQEGFPLKIEKSDRPRASFFFSLTASSHLPSVSLPSPQTKTREKKKNACLPLFVFMACTACNTLMRTHLLGQGCKEPLQSVLGLGRLPPCQVYRAVYLSELVSHRRGGGGSAKRKILF